ncbi:spore gernimation protein [Paenibacillus psychroresistens]|uniref:Spore gernimation protein n=2 Tax=Paenibacillus psychroresistens TaxID=1778678 RepID=A0A6B8RW51_9BACL|nr:spore gernimation protein [Paenibacillus psychroresistens]
MSALFLCFTTGSSVINIPGPLIGFSKNGAWLALLMSLSMGMIFLSLILFLYRRFPNKSMIEYSNEMLGKWITIILAIPFISFLLHIVTGIVLDIGLFMTNSMMRETPLYVFNLLIFLLAATSVRLGIEVMARMFVLLILAVLAFIFFILGLASLNYHPEFLMPVMPYGFKPIVLGAYFSYGFPYLEIVVFAMLLPLVRKESNNKLHRGMYLSLLFNGFCLMAVTVCSIMLFGPIAGEQRYIIFQLARTIEILEIFQRIESLIGISLIVGSYMKATIALYVLNVTIRHLFKIKDKKLMIFPLSLCCFLLSLLVMNGGEAQWIHLIAVVAPLWGTFAFVVPLIVLTIAALFRKKHSSMNN